MSSTDSFSLSPFCTPRKKPGFCKYAILLMEERDEPTSDTQDALSGRISSLAEQLLPMKPSSKEPEDVMTRVGEILKVKIHGNEEGF
jgi:hypothetical protein